MTNQITKKQHQVPQFLLKNFSSDRKSINIFNIDDKTFDLTTDPNTKPGKKSNKIEKRFQNEFFYDYDNLIENFLANKIENPASIVIESIIRDVNLNISSEEKSKLICFVSSLLYRTTEALNQADTILNSTFQHFIKELLRVNNLDEAAAEKGKFLFNSQNLISMSALNGAEKHLVFDDLELALIINKTNIDFYISDHPVFMYNWLYRKNLHPKSTSIFARGLQLFLPISYELTLCLYDPKIYKYGHRNTKIIEIKDTKDINILNSFQVSNANLNIGFRSPSSVINIRELYRRYGNRKIHNFGTKVINNSEDSNESKIQIMSVRRQYELSRMPSFVQTKKFRGKNVDVVSLRNPDLAEAYNELDRRSYT